LKPFLLMKAILFGIIIKRERERERERERLLA
jgi:hypothetical protein